MTPLSLPHNNTNTGVALCDNIGLVLLIIGLAMLFCHPSQNYNGPASTLSPIIHSYQAATVLWLQHLQLKVYNTGQTVGVVALF